MIKSLRNQWEEMAKTKCSGTVAFVDLSNSTEFKSRFPTPDIWLERLSSFLEVVSTLANRMLANPFIKLLGDGVLIFSKKESIGPKEFVAFAEELANSIKRLNTDVPRYTTSDIKIQFKCTLDYGSDLYLFKQSDPQGIIIDRVFRIDQYLLPSTIAASSSFYDSLEKNDKKKFILAGRTLLRGISDRWEKIYALTTIKDYCTELSAEQKKREILTEVWKMGNSDKPIWIVTGAIQDYKRNIYAMQQGDSNAIIEIVHTLIKIYPDRLIEIVPSEEYLRRNSGSFDNDIVCISGPSHNLVAERMLQKGILPIKFELDLNKLNRFRDPLLIIIHVDESESIYEVSRRQSRIIQDWFLFMKTRNPFGEGRYLYMLMGNQTHGTSGAACTFGISSPHISNNFAFLNEILTANNLDFESFGLIGPVSVIDGYAEPPELFNSRNIDLLTVNTKINFFQGGSKRT